MELSKELYLRRYWKVEEILLLLFEGHESAEIERQFYVEEDFTLLKSKFEKKISKAIKSGDLKTHKALDDDNSNYLDRNEFSNWLLASKYKIDIDEFLYGRSIEIQFDDGLDYLDFSDRVYGGGTFTRHDAFCYLRGISIDKTTWSDDDINNYQKFDGFENEKERLNYKEILVIAGKAGLPIPDEMRIPIEEAEKFGIHDQKKTASSWYDITLTLLANKRIECSFEGGSLRKSLEDIGLAKQGNQELTKPGVVLLALSRRAKYPINKAPDGSERKDIGKIRDALRKLCGLTDDPFLHFNPADGWKLKCKLIDKTTAGDQRKREHATHVQFNDDTRPYDEEPDQGGGRLKEHDK